MSVYPKHVWDQLKNTTHEEVENALLKDGWQRIKKSGAKHIYQHPDRPPEEVISIHCHPKKPVARGTLKQIFDDAGWKTEDDLANVGLVKRPKGKRRKTDQN